MSPENEFYYGLGLVTASVIGIVSWAVTELLFDVQANIGIFTAIIVLGLYDIYSGITKGRK